ncbi:MAG: helicase-related protein [Actinomycetota bacterium]|nr:helicase-related protein [Actinomycetota bacterium]
MIIKPGDIIKGSKWPEPVEVKLYEERDNYIRIVGSTINSHAHIDDLLKRDELSSLELSTIELDFKANPTDTFLSLETMRYRFASLYDPLLAMNTSKVDPLPHQIEAVYGYVLKLPRIRFLIADDPGAGKTIMAGLIIKELKLRNIAKRILIVAPGHLKDQWRRELKERFEETFIVIDRGIMEALYGENAWLRENQIITSIDFAKREDIIPSLSSAHFDLVVVDEAHKMSAYRYGDKLDKTGRYKLGEVLSKVSEHLLFLTATPHKGDPENFRLFLDLLEPGFFATSEMLQDSIANKDNPLFIRRIKEDLKNFEGEPLFLPRYVRTVAFDLGIDSPEEKELYNELSKYVNEQYNKALAKDKKRNVAFALVILQRRFASSTYALLRSLERRRNRLQELLSGVKEKGKLDERSFDFETIEDLSEEDRWHEEELWETLSVAENSEELQKEIVILDGLIQKAKDIIHGEAELKVRELRKTLDELQSKYPGHKILIFTESKDTLEYLEKKIKSWGYTINTIHGGMNLEARVEAERIFKNETQVLVATEAAGEGINLQFCHLMINYDIPWNPNRLEQRMGRIHRYGQNKEVFVFNMVAKDTREGKVLNRLFEKLEEIKQALGSDKVFDVLSEVMYGKNLAQLLIEAAAHARDTDDILKDIDVQIDENYIAQVKENLGESLATRYIDYTRIKEMADRAREYRLIPEYTEAFFKKAFEVAGGKFKERADGFISIDSLPFDIRKIAEKDEFKKRFGPILKRYPKITFDKEIAFKNTDAEFVSFGHPLFEATLDWVESKLFISLQHGAVFKDPEGKMDGVILFYEGEIKDGKGTVAGKRLFAFYVERSTDKIGIVNPAIMWDLVPGGLSDANQLNIDELKTNVLGTAIEALEAYMQEILVERKRQAEIKERYGIKSLEYLIYKLDDELITLGERQAKGEPVDIVIRNKKESRENYLKALDELKQTVLQEKSLTMSTPRFVGSVLIIPEEKVEAAMVEDEEIEKIGMQVAMEYETKNERLPEDVSAENLGFDIRSTSKDGAKRYIEVKARAQTGAICLTQNEWFKARRFGKDYYLYVIYNAATEPRLHIVQDPANSLNAIEKLEVVRYVVAAEDVQTKGGIA